MEDATIITLGPEHDEYTTDVADFEEAFGEYSELFGKKAKARRKKRRAERKTRKLQKFADKDEIKRARRSTKQNRKSDRKQDRQQLRIGRRAERKRSRQSMRDEQQQKRQARRDERIARNKERSRFRVEERMARKEMRQGPEDDYEDDYALDQGYDDQGYDDQGGYDDYDDYEEVGYDDDQGGYDDYDDYDDQGGYDQGGYEEDAYYPDDEWGGGGYDDDYGWGGNQDEYVYDDQTWDDYGGFDAESSHASGRSRRMASPAVRAKMKAKMKARNKVHPKVSGCAKKACWNKEMAARLLKRREKMVAAGQATTGIDRRISKCQNRKTQLDARLSKYAASNPKLRQQRVREVMLAKRQAKKELPATALIKTAAPVSPVAPIKQIRPRNPRIPIGRKAAPTPVKAECDAFGGCETPVEADLNPEFSAQKIVIPSIAKSAMNAEGTGSESWETPAYDAPALDPTIVEMDGAGEMTIIEDGTQDSTSGIDGSKDGLAKKVNWKYVAIGVVVAIGAIYALKKYKVLK